ncbi:MAG: sulfite exporter TauE/SafE family protein, partial [Rhodospirillaceae bacterium]|nr:sulfite exporter TauE/SafE family protein [Rhodospirillaceae bacterium]
MIFADLEFVTLLVVAAGALVAGFTTGFAGFGTALIASGLWLHVLPPILIPPLVTIAAVVAHIVVLATTRPTFDWATARPYLIGGLVGIPLGVVALSLAGPGTIRVAVGVFLVVFAISQLSGAARFSIGSWGGRVADAGIGLGGGVLGGFAGLSGPFPIVWLQMRGGPSAGQRAIYQPFNLVVLAFAAVGMAIAGLVDTTVLTLAVVATPLTVLGSWLGARTYLKVSEQTFRTIVL